MRVFRALFRFKGRDRRIHADSFSPIVVDIPTDVLGSVGCQLREHLPEAELGVART